MMCVSVTSSVSEAGGRPCLRRQLVTYSGSWVSSRLRTETLTATESGMPLRCQDAHSATAVSTTKWVRSRICAVCSATGTNSTGLISPYCGWFHLTRASAETTRPVDACALGW